MPERVPEPVAHGSSARTAKLVTFGLVLSLLAAGCDQEQPSATGGSATASAAAVPSAAAGGVGELRLLRHSVPVRDLSLAELERRVKPEPINTQDPYLGGERSYDCVPVMRLLDVFFDLAPGDAATFTVRFVAKDGYEVFVSGARLAEGRACFALRRAGGAPIEPLGPAKADGAPLYLSWPGAELTNLTTHPRPWAVVTIDLDPDRGDLAATSPKGGFGKDAVAERGHALFVERCVRCHSVNQAGGKLGPDLNVPQNILAYRPREQVRAYIKNPATFRYSQMPAHLDLADSDLDALLGYLDAMAKDQRDPHAGKDRAHGAPH